MDGLKLIHQLKEKYRLSPPQIKDAIQRSTDGIGLELMLDVRNQSMETAKNRRIRLDQRPLDALSDTARVKLSGDSIRLITFYPNALSRNMV